MSDEAGRTVTPYDVLGVSPSASSDEIRRAYLALARRHHPDAGGSDEEMRRLNEAWVALSTAAVPASSPSDEHSDVDTTPQQTCDPEDEYDDIAFTPSPRSRLLDSLTLLALLATVASAALSFLFGMLFESGPLLGFCVFSLFMSGVLVVARTLLAMGFDRGRGP